MKLGTPLSDSAKRVMLLGSGELGKEVIIALQRLGVETIAVDRYADAPGRAADRPLQPVVRPFLRTHIAQVCSSWTIKHIVNSELRH